MSLLLLAFACGGGGPGSTTAEPAALTATVTSAKVQADQPVELTLRGAASTGWTVTPGEPSAEGLTVERAGEEGPVLAAGRAETRWRYTLRGPPGSYVIEPGTGQATGPDGKTTPIEVPPLFVDIGVVGPIGGPMAEFEAAPPPPGPPWAWIAAGAAAFGLTSLLLWRWSRPRPVLPPPPPDPPHVRAARDWATARAEGLDDHALAVALSRVLRVYLEEISGWPATARTGREILRWLEQDRLLEHSDRARAGRILDATDRLKFAREGGGEAFFAELDDNFAAILEATRPPDPTPAAPPAPEAPRA